MTRLVSFDSSRTAPVESRWRNIRLYVADPTLDRDPRQDKGHAAATVAAAP